MTSNVYIIGEKPTRPHPEQRLGETFFKNCPNDEPDEFDNIPYQTKRAGMTAYDENGKVLIRHFPVFVELVELNVANQEVKIGQ